jgi:hypothetical protein
MAAPNIDPIYSKKGDVSNNATTGMNQLVTAAANDYTGAGANNSLVFTADATNGGFVQRLRFKAGGTNVASVARIFINNGAAQTTAANNVFYGEVTLPATTAIATAATVELDYPMGFALNAGFRIYFGLGTAVAAGWVCTAISGVY